MSSLLEKLLPILFLILIGVVLRKSNVITKEAVNSIKNMILKIGLPAVLFTAFAKATIEGVYFYMFAIVFGLCVVLYGIGSILNRSFPKIYGSPYTSAYFTGFEFGMVGIGLFTALWGVEQLPILMMIGFGHEIFIWFFFVPILEYKKIGHANIKKIFISFIKSPIIIAILVGMLVNVLQIYDQINGHFLGRSVMNTLTMLSNIVSPLILIVIGYMMTIKAIPIKKAIGYILGRWFVVGVFGTISLSFILFILPHQDAFFVKAFIAFLILPPPYILPIFMKEEAKKEQSFFSDLLVYHTLTSFLGFIILLILR